VSLGWVLSDNFRVGQLFASCVNKLFLFVNKLFLFSIGAFSGRLADPSSPVGQAYRFARPAKRALDIANTSLLLEFATARFVSGFLESHLQDAEGGSGVPFGRRQSPADVLRLQQLLSALSTVDISQSLAAPRDERCDELNLPCDHSRKYRSYTGWCNNLRRPHQGKSLRAFNRLLPPAYQDGECSKIKTRSRFDAGEIIEKHPWLTGQSLVRYGCPRGNPWNH